MRVVSDRSALLAIDPICERFELALRERRAPRIEDFLVEVQEPSRGHLFRELLALELHYLGRAATPEILDRYRTRYPQYDAQLVDLASSRGSGGAARGVELTPGQVFGECTIVREVGRGGMGIVYEARHAGLQRRVALKVLLPAGAPSARADRRFELEARAVARLQSPNIVPVFEAGQVSGIRYYTMPLIEGRSLADRIGEARRRGAESKSGRAERVGRALARTEAIARALEYAHSRGVVHRDVKPSNVLVDDDGVAWLVDFGLAKLEGSDLTQGHELLGTIRYLPPERLELDAEGDARGDVYALGVTLFEALTLTPAYPEQDPKHLVRAILERDVPRLRTRLPGASRELETLVATAVARDPERRYASAGALADDLARLRAGLPIAARRASVADRVALWVRRNRAATAALVLAIVVAIVSTTAALVFRSQRSRITSLSNDLGGLLHDSERARESLRQALYLSDMRRCADSASRSTRAAAVVRSLDAWVPDPGQPDLRGWEWRLLRSMVGVESGNVWREDFGGSAVDWHPDGSTVAMSGRLGVSLWDADDLEERWSVHAGQHPSCVRFSPDGSRLAVCDSSSVRVLEVATGETVARLEGEGCRDLAWHPDGTHLVLGGSLRVWDTADGGLLERTEIQSFGLLPAVDADGRRLVFASSPTRVRVVEWGTWRDISEYRTGVDLVGDVDLSPDGRRAVVASRADELHVFDTGTGERLLVIPGAHEATIHSVRWSGDGSMLVSCSADSTVRVHDAQDGALLRQFLGHQAHVLAACFSPDSSHVASVSRGGNLRRWSLARATGRVETHRTPDGWRHRTAVLGWSAEQSAFALSCAEGVEAWRRGGLRPVRERAPGRWVLARSSDGRLLLDIGPDGAAIREARAGDVLLDLTTLGVSADAAASLRPLTAQFTPDADRCVISANGSLWLADALSGSPTLRKVETEDPVRDFELTADGRRMACSSWETVRLLDVETGAVSGAVSAALFDVPGHDYRVAVCGPLPGQLAVVHGARLLVLDGETLAARQVFVDHGGPIMACSWSPDGDRIATGSLDGSVGIFDPDHGLTASLPSAGPVIALAWSADSRQLAALDVYGDLVIWDASAGYGVGSPAR